MYNVHDILLSQIIFIVFFYYLKASCVQNFKTFDSFLSFVIYMDILNKVLLFFHLIDNYEKLTKTNFYKVYFTLKFTYKSLFYYFEDFKKTGCTYSVSRLLPIKPMKLFK